MRFAYRPFGVPVVASVLHCNRRRVNPLAQLSERQYKQNMTEALAQLARAADWVGDAVFYCELLKAFGKHLGADLSMVMRYSRRHAPEYIIHLPWGVGHWEEMQYAYTGSAERLSGCV